MSVQPPTPLPPRVDPSAAAVNGSANRNSISSNSSANRNSVNAAADKNVDLNHTTTTTTTTTSNNSNNATTNTSNAAAAAAGPLHPSLNSLSDSALTAQTFFDAVRAFTSSATFHGTAELIDEVPRLRKVVADRERELRALGAALDEQRREHERAAADERRERDRIASAFLETYNREYERHRGEGKEKAAEIERLEAEVRRQREDIARLHKSDEELVRQGSKARAALEAEKEKCEKAAKVIADSKREMERRGEAARKEAERKGAELAEMAARLKKAEAEAAKAKSSLLVCHRENEDLQADLADTTERLVELESFTEPLSDEKWETSISLLDELWRSCHDLISSYFRKDLPKEILMNSYAWSEIKKPEDFSHNIPLPQTNSAAAKSMRIAVILAILARLIDKYLFQPSYILHEESGLREILIRQAIENSKREAFTRGIFLATFEDEQAEIADELVTRIVKELMHHIHDLLPAAHVEGFRARLEQIVQDARDIWWKAQRLRLRLEPDFQVEDYGWERPIQFQFDHHPHPHHAGALPAPKQPQQQAKVDTPQQSPPSGSSSKASASASASPQTPNTGSSAAITPGMPAPVGPHIPVPLANGSNTSSSTPKTNTHHHSHHGLTLPLTLPPDESLLLIFPRIYIVEDDDPEPVTPGTVLLRSQADDAERELHLLAQQQQQQKNVFGNGFLGGVGRAGASHRNSGGGGNSSNGGGSGGNAGNGVMRVGGPRPRRLSVPQMEEIPEVPTPGEEKGGQQQHHPPPPPASSSADGGGGGGTAATSSVPDSEKKDFLGQRAGG
ncbi:hypothetical protein SLS55_009003 [Diplodia seriata]|uniref:Mei5 protein n=1 Tax=Diplodia seriata TaxID=420778 RepID=A0ABR3C7L4_9PEZI